MVNLINDKALIKIASYINGAWVKGDSFFTVNSALIGKPGIAIAGVTDVETKLAVKSANDALSLWSNQTAHERSDILSKWYDLIIKAKDDLALILTIEQGKPLSESHTEISYGSSFIQWFSEEAKRVYGDIIPASHPNKTILTLKQPVGVVSAITPWNFPHAMITRKVAAALAAGCTIVVKPAAETPLSALALAELAHRAGIPKGVFNVVVGENSEAIGKVLTQDERIAKFSFTGSTATGKKLIAQCASTVKKVSMELGGNAPFIVFNDANLAKAVDGAIKAKHRNSGQACIAANRFYIQHEIYDEFLAKYIQNVKLLKQGSGFNLHTNVGPLISAAAVQKTQQLVQKAIAAGAQLVYQFDLSALPTECDATKFYPISILTNVTTDMEIAQTELFAPVSIIIRFDEEADVIEQANNTPYGLASYFYTQDISRVWRVSKALQYGMVGVNDWAISNASAPFGGIKSSGNGREGSKYGLDDYLEIKYILLDS